MKTGSFLAAAAGLAAAGIAAAPAPAQQSATQAGTLVCDVSSGVGMIVEQKQTMQCTFTPANGPPEAYLGRIDEFGVALGAVSQGQLIWAVLAPASGVPRGALSGTYTGIGAQASAGPGVGANLLVGGTGRAFSLQPLSVSGQVGLNIAAGVTTVTLLPPPMPPVK